MATSSAVVETLTAEVRVLMVGNRQVTLSVYRQLDTVTIDQIDPFGRVNDSKDDGLWVVGRHIETGVLCRARIATGGKFVYVPSSLLAGRKVVRCVKHYRYRHDEYKASTAVTEKNFKLPFFAGEDDEPTSLYVSSDDVANPPGYSCVPEGSPDDWERCIDGWDFTAVQQVIDDYIAKSRSAADGLPLIVLAGLR